MENPEGRRKVVFWNLFTTGASHAVVTELVDRFNSASPDYYVEQVDIPYAHIHSKILPAVAGDVALPMSPSSIASWSPATPPVAPSCPSTNWPPATDAPSDVLPRKVYAL